MTSDDLGWPLMASDDFRAGVAQESLGRADEGSMRRGAPARKRLHAARHDTTPLSKRRRRWGRTVVPWVRGPGKVDRGVVVRRLRLDVVRRRLGLHTCN